MNGGFFHGQKTGKMNVPAAKPTATKSSQPVNSAFANCRFTAGLLRFYAIVHKFLASQCFMYKNLNLNFKCSYGALTNDWTEKGSEL